MTSNIQLRGRIDSPLHWGRPFWWLDGVFLGSIPPEFEPKLRHHEQRFGKITTTALLDKDEHLFCFWVAMTSELS